MATGAEAMSAIDLATLELMEGEGPLVPYVARQTVYEEYATSAALGLDRPSSGVGSLVPAARTPVQNAGVHRLEPWVRVHYTASIFLPFKGGCLKS